MKRSKSSENISGNQTKNCPTNNEVPFEFVFLSCKPWMVGYYFVVLADRVIVVNLVGKTGQGKQINELMIMDREHSEDGGMPKCQSKNRCGQPCQYHNRPDQNIVCFAAKYVPGPLRSYHAKADQAPMG